MDFTVKAEVVEFLCQAPFDQVQPVHMAQWCQQVAAGHKSGNYTYETKSIAFIADEVRQYPGEVKPRTNADGMITLSSGDIWILPQVDNVQKMHDLYDTYQNADGLGDFTFKSDIPVKRVACKPEETDVTGQERGWVFSMLRNLAYGAASRRGISIPVGINAALNKDPESWDQYFESVRKTLTAFEEFDDAAIIVPNDASPSVSALLLRTIQHLGMQINPNFGKSLERAASTVKTDPFSRPITTPVDNMLVFTDWLNNKLVYTNTQGVESTLDLNSAVATNATHVASRFDTQIREEDSNDSKAHDLLTTTHQMMKLAIGLGFKLDLTDPKYGLLQLAGLHYGGEQYAKISVTDWQTEAMEAWKNEDQSGHYAPTQKLIRQIQNMRATLGNQIDSNGKQLPDSVKDLIAEYNGLPASYGDPILPGELMGGQLPVFSFLNEAAQFLATKGFDTTKVVMDVFLPLTKGAIYARLKACAQLYMVIDAFKPGRYMSLIAEDVALRSAYLSPQLPDPEKMPALPGAAAGVVYMPHQARIRSMLIANRPKYAYIEVDAGGGKTIQILSDVLDSLLSGDCTLPAIVCPGYLVKDYVKEANFLLDGKMNVIPINTDSVANYTMERLYEVIVNSPPNTVLVISYDFMAGKISEEVYGRTSVTVYHNVEFLQQFMIDCAWFDEAHNVRKDGSQRTQAVRSFTCSVPRIRLASGTSAVDQVTDIVSQFSLMDPTVFGDFDDFVAEYAEETRGGKVVRWKPMAEVMVRRKMSEHCMILSAKRREWASLLPERKENFFFVNLSPNQRSMYDAIVKETIEEIKENNPKLIQMMNEGDEGNSDLIEAILGPYLQRLEQFMSAPARDKAAVALKDPNDLVSPKAKKITEIVKRHISDGVPGKILIFTSYKASAEEIFKALPPDIRKRFIHYTAEQKVACEKEFASNPNMIGMIGVENSMNTGLNLQFCSRLIRVESVWSPGLMEQGESRVNRPNLKIKEFRTGLFFDWVLVDNSIDITKVGRLIAKQVSNARYENWDNPSYLGLETPPLVSMNLDSIIENNSFETELVEHFDALQALIACRKEDYKNWQNDPNAFKKAVPLKRGKLLEGSKLLLNPPYCPGMSIYGAQDLLLEDLNSWRMSNADEDLVGRTVHCEFGDVEVVRVNKRTVQVRLPDGKRKGVQFEAAWVIGKDRDDPRETRKILQEMVGMSDSVYVPNYYETNKTVVKVKPLTHPAEIQPDATKPSVLDRTGLIPQDKGLPDGEILLYATVINNRLALGVDVDDPDIALKQLKDYGFQSSGPSNYIWAEVRMARHLRAVIDGLQEKFTVQNRYLNVLEELYETFTEGRTKLLNIKQANKVEFRDFMRLRFKPCPAGEVRPYPMLQDGALYVVMEADKCPSAKQVPNKVRVPGVKWEKENSPSYLCYVDTKKELIELVKQMRRDGVQIGNMDELKDDVKEVRLLPPVKRD